MYISVIPTSKSQGSSSIIYTVNTVWETQIVLGGIVEVPFGKDVILAIVAAIHGDAAPNMENFEIRPIHSVISTSSIIDEIGIRVILDISRKYFLPLHKALSLFLPASLLHRLEKRNYVLSRGDPRGGVDEHGPLISIHHFIKHTFSPSDFRDYLKPGTVLIFPDDVMLYNFVDTNEKENVLILSTEATITKRLQGWIDIYEGKYEIIVGTRRLLYYNLTAYTNIIYIEDAFGGEQFQYPISIRSLDVLSSIAKNSTYRITIISSSPTLELFSKFSNAKIIPIK